MPRVYPVRKSKAEKAAYQRIWTAANPNYRREWCIANPVKARAWALANPEKVKAINLRWAVRNPKSKQAVGRKQRLKQFNLTPSQYDEMLKAQNFTCAICGVDNPGRSNIKHFPVDHCHKTGRVRGLLCHHCNLALGTVKDDVNILRKMIQYLTVQS